MHSNSFAFRLPFFLLGFGIVIGIPAQAPAQQLYTKEMGTAYRGSVESRFRQLILAAEEQDRAQKADVKVAEAAANYYVLRVTSSLEKEMSAVNDDFNKMVAQAMGVLDLTSKKPRPNRDFIDMFAPKLVDAMTQVLNRDASKDPSTVVHASMMLQSMAKLKQEKIADYLVTLINKKDTHGIIQVYALKGMKEYLPVTSYDENANFFNKTLLAKKSTDIKYVEALAAFIERDIDIDELPTDQGEAVRYIRREAIASLANAGVPAVIAFAKPMKIDGKMVQVEGLVAPTLLKVLAKDALNPPTTLHEKIEASIGLLNMKISNMPDYNPDLATYLVGRTLLEFMAEYNRDLQNFVGANKKVPFVAWKTESRRLEAAVAQWAKTNGEKSNAERLNASAGDVLKSVYNNQVFRPIPEGQQAALRNVVPMLAPKTGGAVFKNAKAPAIPVK
jgi:hypothetical protein